MNYILLSVLGAISGTIAGAFGIGGAIIIVPALVLLFSFDQKTAQGTSLAMLLPPIGILAVWRYWQDGHVNITAAIILATSFLVFSLLGAHIAVALPQILLKRLFGGMLVIVGMIMIFCNYSGR